MTLKLSSLGGAGAATGSKHLLDDGVRRVLVDCRMFQGVKMLRERNWAPFQIDPASVDAIASRGRAGRERDGTGALSNPSNRPQPLRCSPI
jgi:hypothetical protein